MPRSKIGVFRKKISEMDMLNAVNFVLQQKMSLSEAARHCNIKKSTLIYQLKQFKKSGSCEYLYSHTKPKKVFSTEEELILVNYLAVAANMHYGLTLKQIRSFAYEYALANHKKIETSWMKNKCAGEQWLRDFRKRYNNKLSLGKPQPTSLGRSSAFNRETVRIVYKNCKNVLERYHFDPSNIWNCDETGITTVHVPPKILAPKGKKQIGSITSAERGNNVTMIAAINATGNSIPSLLVFPRAKFKDYMLNNCPPGSVGAANKSGWSNEVIFVQFLEHFISNVRPSIKKPVLLLMDNHESHVNISVIELAKKSGIVLMTFHPHTTHKMQPLDRGVFGPFKTFYNNAMNNWMISPGNAGKPVTIFDISYLVGQAYPHAFVPNNIINSFKCTGFYPFNENIFTDIDFLAANVTDRPIVNTEACLSNEIIDVKTAPSSVPSTSSIVLGEIPTVSLPSRSIVSPEIIRPHPKAKLRKTNTSKRRDRKSCILTDTPEIKVILDSKSNNQQFKKTSSSKRKKNGKADYF
ncbi:tigger transposable element-derived protein 1-like [Hydra vulgaris]|uniref:Tigger transposable element-derived protein 1-like n=1 Tax=Hydra vulgaris TaxID=6087 RepID=A0ABM4DDF7_HYDVU